MVLAPRSSTLPKLQLKPGRWTVGSAATCSYRIAAEGVRPRHALLLCGQQATVLKAWDSHTWHNDQPVLGEVRLQPGDRVTIGSVEFSLESDGSLEVLTKRPDVEPVATSLANFPTEASDLERLRDQIHELRDELSQRMTRRNEAVSRVVVAEVPIDRAASTTDTRIEELERSTAEARSLVEQTQQTLADTRLEHERREAELQQVADQLRATLDATQMDVAELRRERDDLRSQATQQEQNWQQQFAEWSAEREQWQEDLLSLANTRQQVATEFEQRLATLAEEATRWKTECEQLHDERFQQQAEWEAERSQLQDELRRIESNRVEEALNDLRQQIDQQAADVATKAAELSQRLAEFEQQQSEFTREKLTLEHSWMWLQSDRKKLAEEKDGWQQQRAQWQAERESWAVEGEQLETQRQQFRAEQSAWSSQREQFESDCQARSAELATACAEFQSQQQSLCDEQARLEDLRAELDARAADLECDRQALLASQPVAHSDTAIGAVEQELQNHTLPNATGRPLDVDWKSDATATSPTWNAESISTGAELTDPWNIGVDLTAARETLAADWSNLPAGGSESLSSGESGEATSPELLAEEATNVRDAASSAAPDGEWDAAISTPVTTDAEPGDTLDSDVAKLREKLAESESAATPVHSETTPTTATKHRRIEQEPLTVPTSGSVVSILESMAFSDDEDIDDSVSRYMQHLLARSQSPAGATPDRYISASAIRHSATATTQQVAASSEAEVTDRTPTDEFKSNAEPNVSPEDDRAAVESLAASSMARSPMPTAQLQDKTAIRAVTERMRLVANQQTVKNIEASNRKQLRQSVKYKLVLAAIAFLLSSGLLFWGYYYRPDFLILGVFASGLGILTWLDLILSIRQAHIRTSQLAGRKQLPGKAKE